MVDVFIGYHLSTDGKWDTEDSSYKLALKVQSVLEGMGVRTFLRDPEDSTETFRNTKLVAQTAKKFLLIINRHVDKKCEDIVQGNGMVIRAIAKGTYVYEEISGFLNQYGGKAEGLAKGKIQCYCEDEGYADERIEKLHSAFSQMVAIRNEVSLRKWVAYKPQEEIAAASATPKDWDLVMADVWKNIYAPSKPSASEVEAYRTYFRYLAKSNTHGNKLRALIMGSTVEFRMLAAQEGFETVVVDYNEDYYREVSKGLDPSIYYAEKLVVCDWSEMKNHPDLAPHSFDIVIGDLAIGNIKPEKLDAVFEGVYWLLRDGGCFLGKNLYSFECDTVDAETIESLIKDYFATVEEDTCQAAYEKTMYDLSVWARQSDKKNKIDFDKIYEIVQKVCKDLGKENSKLYEMYCGESTSFKEKMELSFYVYPIYQIAAALERAGLTLTDTDYGKDEYSHKFPLMVFRKNVYEQFDVEQEKHSLAVKIKSYVMRSARGEYVAQWQKYISSQYFLVKLSDIFSEMKDNNKWKEVFNEIKKSLINTVRVGVSDDLICYINYIDEKIEEETKRIKNVEELPGEGKDIIGINYTLAVLVYLTSALASNYQKANSLHELVAEKLLEQREEGTGWEPEEAPWVRAKVCLAVKNIYHTLSEEFKEAVTYTVDMIALNDAERVDWRCDVGSHVDTRALCIEVLLEYYYLIEDANIRGNILKRLSAIMQRYILKDRMYETYVRYPIGRSVVQNVLADKKLRGKPYAQKLIVRVEFLSVLLRVIDFAKKHAEDLKKIRVEVDMNDLVKQESLLVKFFRRFWRQLEKEQEGMKLVAHMSDCEISAVPQILYSLSKAFIG